MNTALRLPLEDPTYDTGAVFSECQRYRYRLWRRWKGPGTSKGRVNFILLNPSTADATTDDPTVRRCEGFARSWGYGEIIVTNLFAFRSTDPAALRDTPDPVGPHNDMNINSTAMRSDLIVCAWGAGGLLLNRAERVCELLRDFELHYLKLTERGKQPSHPLYLHGGLQPQLWVRT